MHTGCRGHRCRAARSAVGGEVFGGDVFVCGSVTETGFHGLLICVRVNCSALSGGWECAGKVASALIWRVCRWPYVLKGARWCEMKRRAGSNRKLGDVVASRTLTEEGHP